MGDRVVVERGRQSASHGDDDGSGDGSDYDVEEMSDG